MKIEDVKVKVVVDDAQARAVIDELMRGAAAFEQLLVGIGQALSSDAGQAVVIDALVGRIEELKAQLGWAREQTERARERAEMAHVDVVLNARWPEVTAWELDSNNTWRAKDASVELRFTTSFDYAWRADLVTKGDAHGTMHGYGDTWAGALLDAIVRAAHVTKGGAR